MSVTVLLRRCAWCRRTLGRDGWRTSAEEATPHRETATICPECAEKLRAIGLSH